MNIEILLVIYLIVVLCIIQHYIQLADDESPICFIFFVLKILVCIETVSTGLVWYWELIHTEV